MRALARPEVDDDDFAASIAQAMKLAIEVRQFKVRSRFVKVHISSRGAGLFFCLEFRFQIRDDRLILSIVNQIIQLKRVGLQII